MKKNLVILVTFSLMLTPYILFAGGDDKVIETNMDRLSLQKTGMITLGSWAIGNIAVGSIRMGQTTGSQYRFHQMNVFWNLVNLGIAAGGYYGAATADPASFTAIETLKEYHSFNKILLLNAGLDVGYVLGGLYLSERSKNVSKRQNMLKGYGQSIMLQGGFLFVFDLVLYGFMNEQTHAFMNSSGLSLLTTPGKIELVYSF
ncbi:MAG: hypothetical protein K9I74_10770 [Bacteroidales bacterium]|nr:hypothetical protein [Bacteroidales bacterium]